MKTFRVRLSGNSKEFEVRSGESVLNGALRQGVMLPYSCKNGTCGNCRGRLVEGEVHYPFHPPLALTREEMAASYTLLCQAEPLEDLVVEAREIEAIRDIPVLRLPARVTARELLGPNIMQLRLRLPAAQRLQFLAGQHVEIILPGGKRRAFSIASPPVGAEEIELHVRHVEGGDFTGQVFNELKLDDILRLEGPLGTFFVRHDRRERPLLMVGGGTGFAPLKSMIEDLLAHADPRPIHLFRGARKPAELYLEDLVAGWLSAHPHIRHSRALSDAVADAVDGSDAFAGMVHEAVLAQYPDLSGHDIYMSGPPLMIETAKAAFLSHGALPERLFYDSFEFGLDVPVRILARPH